VFYPVRLACPAPLPVLWSGALFFDPESGIGSNPAIRSRALKSWQLSKCEILLTIGAETYAKEGPKYLHGISGTERRPLTYPRSKACFSSNCRSAVAISPSKRSF
jgi:hypothetical protein